MRTADRTQGIIDRLAGAENYDAIKWILQSGVTTNYTESVVDAKIKANCDFQGRAGLTAKVERVAVGKTCQWCQDVAGEYVYPNVPADVWRRHERCNCIIKYTAATGRVDTLQGSGSTWFITESTDPEAIKNRKNFIGVVSEPNPIVSETESLIDHVGARSIPKKPTRPRRADFTDYEELERARQEYKIAMDEYEQAMNELIREDMQRERKIKTFDDFEKWADAHGVDVSELKGSNIDPLLFDDIAEVETEMFEKYPQVREYMEQTKDRYARFDKFRIGISDNNIASMDSPPGGMRVSRNWDREHSRFALKETYSQIADGFNVYGDGTIRTVIRHEYGHNVDWTIRHRIADKYHYFDDDWREHFDTLADYRKAQEAYRETIKQYNTELMELAKLDGVSEYAHTDELELFAEGFGGFTSGGRSEFEIAFGEFLDRWL